MKQQYVFIYDAEKLEDELENFLSSMGKTLREKEWEKVSELDMKHSRKGKLIVVGLDTENEEWIINNVGGWAGLAFQKETGRNIPWSHPARRSLRVVTVFDVVSQCDEPILSAVVEHPDNRGFSKLIPKSFEINTLQITELITELNKLKLLKISDPNIKWILER